MIEDRRKGPPHPGMIGAIPPSWVDRRRPEPAGFRHNEVAVLSAFAEAVIGLHRCIEDACDVEHFGPAWCERAARHAAAAVRAARMLTVREEYR